MRIPSSILRLRFVAALLSFGMSSMLLGQTTLVSGEGSHDPSTDFHAMSSDSPSSTASNLPDAPGFYTPAPAERIVANQRGGEPWEGDRVYGPFSRIGVGANVSPLGIGINSATVLTRDLDARLLIDFFNFNVSNFDISGFEGNASLHLFSMGAGVDAYPHNSIWRLSGGLMMHNGNNFSGSGGVVQGQSFTVNGATFYSAKANAVTGATPVTGSGTLNLHASGPEFFVSGGFGRFVPRSERHWSFPTEFGALFMGAPTVSLTTAGWVCKTPSENCSDIASTTNPVATEFNNDLQEQLTKWRHSLSAFRVYPMFSYSVVYSFDLPERTQ